MTVSDQASPAVGGLLDAVVGISEGLDLERVLLRLVQAAAAHTGARYAALGVLGPDGLHETFIHHGMPEALVERIGALPRGHGVLGLITREQSVVRVDDISGHPAAYGFPAGHPPMTSFLGVPLRVRDEVFGNLYLTEKPGGFDEHDVGTVQTLAAAAAVAIDNARLFRSVARREAWATAAQRVTTELLQGTDEEDALGIIAAQARLVAVADLAALVLPSIDGAPVVEVVDGDEPVDLIGVSLPEGVRPAGGDPDQGCVVRNLSAAAGPAFAAFGPAMLAPLADDSGHVGVLLLARRPGRPGFSPSDVATASSFASQAALALRLATARRQADVVALYEERQRIARDLHDLAVQQLFAAGMQLSRLRRVRPGDEDVWVPALDSAVDGIDEAVTQIRATIRSLHGEEDGTGLADRLQREAQRARGPLGFDPVIVLDPSAVAGAALDPDLCDDITAVVREALSNIARHARASSAVIRLDLGPRVLTLSIDDDGVGIHPDATAPGARRSGLANFEARARHHDGSCTVSRGSHTGTRVVWQVPLGDPD